MIHWFWTKSGQCMQVLLLPSLWYQMIRLINRQYCLTCWVMIMILISWCTKHNTYHELSLNIRCKVPGSWSLDLVWISVEHYLDDRRTIADVACVWSQSIWMWFCFWNGTIFTAGESGIIDARSAQVSHKYRLVVQYTHTSFSTLIYTSFPSLITFSLYE
jgi:hypothetical protein